MLKTTPAVFAVGNNYQIMVPVTKPSLFWVEVDGKVYTDSQNGIMRSICTIHRVTVPMEVLDKAGKYTVCEKEIIDRKPYFPETEETVKTEYNFYPVPMENPRVYHVADTHNMTVEPIKAAKVFGDIDLLILNGDIPDHSGAIENYDVIYEIIGEITKGEKPTVFSRGNHDLRGYFAEAMAEYTPNYNGNTYYTFKVGPIWGIVLDCGEDKDDTHPEYGFTVSCHEFRERQIDFIKEVIKNKEYEADDITCKMVVCHNPFTNVQKEPFDIEKEIYSQWASLLKEYVKPNIMLAGHIHDCFISEVGSDYDHLGQPCVLVVGSDKSKEYHAGCGLTIGKDAIESVFCDSDGKVFGKTILKIED